MLGQIPECQTPKSLQFNFLNGEKLVQGFDSVRYLEDKVRRQYVGGPQGVSIRIVRGVYYRVGRAQ